MKANSDNLKELTTKVDEVIVYQSGVQITEKGSINLTEGNYTLQIPQLSDSVDKESIRVKGTGKGKIVNIDISFNSKKQFKKEEHAQLQEQLDHIQKEIEKTQTRTTRIDEQMTQLKNAEEVFYQDFPRSLAYGENKVSNFLQFTTEINSIIQTKLEEKQELKEDLADLTTQKEVIQNKINKLGPIEKIVNFYRIKINLSVQEAGKFRIQLRYTMKNAWWEPYYDIALTEEGARLTMMANVYNRTGIDWERVKMEISTASLKPISLSKPDPLIIRASPPPRPKADFKRRIMPTAGAPAPQMKKLAEEPKREEAEEETPQLEQSYAEVSENIGIQSFKIPKRLTIPSDKDPHPVNLTVETLKSTKEYFWSVSQPNQVIIKDKLTNKDLLLLAGNVKVYYQEEFLGETSIPLIAPKEEFKLGTRVSYDLKVDKKLIDRSQDKKLLKNNIRKYYEYKITIENLNEVTEPLTLYDKIPHSDSEKISVELEEIDLEPDKIELGVLKWKIDLKEKKKLIIKYKFHVEYKKGIKIRPPLP
ncbi:MAG: mucoidy inhibitor MuiA family protein [Promethearchaeia archaeon]